VFTLTKYYYGSEVYGRVYDWNKIFKIYDSLGIPSTCWKVKKESLKSKYSVILSGRSIGKTTNVLLLGLCQRKEYGTTVVYVRSQETEFTPTEAKHLHRDANATFIRALRCSIFSIAATHCISCNSEGKKCSGNIDMPR
jgi:hypothetical protein